MKVRIMGCGHAFSLKNYNQSFLLEDEGQRMLIDCGSRIPLAFHDQKFNFSDLDAIYISHQHADHCGGLEEVAFSTYDWATRPEHYSQSKSKVIKLIANEGLMDDLWNETLKGGLKSMEGFPSTLETFFEPVKVKSNEVIKFGSWDMSLIQQIHIIAGTVFSPTYGVFLKKEGHKTIYFTTDSQHCSPKQTEVFYNMADVIFQDCECSGIDMKTGKVDFTSGVHANYGELAGFDTVNAIRLPKEIKNKMWLSHYQDFVSEGKDYKGQKVDWDKEAIVDGFRGFVKVGQVFNF